MSTPEQHTYTTSKTDSDLSGIIDLQKSNLAQNLTKTEMQRQGFLTVAHSLSTLKKMQAQERNIIIKDQNKIIGYLLAMTKKSRLDIPILIPMFEIFDKVQYNGKLVSEYNYIVVGQVCINKNNRGKGLLNNCYEIYKNYFKNKYDFAITEIATTNKRSINAHKRIGFEEIYKFKDFNSTEWSIVIWDWNSINKNT